MKKIILLLVISFFVLSCSLAQAKTYHITLLTVGEVGDDTVGGTADAYLEIRPGTGRIFLDSFPLTKLDTQISTRYANKIACDYLDKYCDNLDFFYTIRADSTIVGGPSASASLTILTIAALQNSELANDTVMTGTINSGGSIGPVGGIIKKAAAAEKAGFKQVLIPLFAFEIEDNLNNTNISDNITINNTINIANITINTTDSSIQNATLPNLTRNNIKDIIIDPVNENLAKNKTGNNLTIKLIKVRNIDEALPYFIKKPFQNNPVALDIPAEYIETMKRVSDALCSHASELKANSLLNESEDNRSADLEKKINSSIAEKNYYAGASYCFNLGVIYRKNIFRKIGQDNPQKLNEILILTRKATSDFDNRLEIKNLTTLSELESYIIVKERLIESEQGLLVLEQNMSSNELAYFLERYYSAVYWSEFFKLKGKPIILDDKYLKDACYKKLSEAEERVNYASLYLPTLTNEAQSSIVEAYGYAEENNFKMCMFKASFAKAEANLLLSIISVDQNQLAELTQEKLRAAKILIAREGNRGEFPILGYSYYEYSSSLHSNNDDATSLIFAEYSLELSNMGMYFPVRSTTRFNIDSNIVVIGITMFFFGLAVGIIISLILLKKKKHSGLKKARTKNK
jgi:uncharacterized protein